MVKQVGEIGFQPHQDRLRLRVAKAAVELQRVYRRQPTAVVVRADHQAGIKKPT